MTALWNTTTGPYAAASPTRSGSRSSRSPASSRGGSVRAAATAVRSRPRRSSCSGQTRFSSHAIASASATSSGCRSIPPRQRHGRRVGRAGQRAGHRAGQQRPRPGLDEAVVGAPRVGPAVGVEAQPGARADLQQRQRATPLAPGQLREPRHQRRQPADLVGLGRPLQDRGPDRRRRRRAAPAAAPRTDPGPGRRATGAAANTRLGCCLTGGRPPIQASTSASSATASRPRPEAGRVAGVAGEVGVLPGDVGVELHADGQSPGSDTYVVSRYSSIPSKPPSRP